MVGLLGVKCWNDIGAATRNPRGRCTGRLLLLGMDWHQKGWRFRNSLGLFTQPKQWMSWRSAKITICNCYLWPHMVLSLEYFTLLNLSCPTKNVPINLVYWDVNVTKPQFSIWSIIVLFQAGGIFSSHFNFSSLCHFNSLSHNLRQEYYFVYSL